MILESSKIISLTFKEDASLLCRTRSIVSRETKHWNVAPTGFLVPFLGASRQVFCKINEEFASHISGQQLTFAFTHESGASFGLLARLKTGQHTVPAVRPVGAPCVYTRLSPSGSSPGQEENFGRGPGRRPTHRVAGTCAD